MGNPSTRLVYSSVVVPSTEKALNGQATGSV
jgi:hypothetical protein